MKTCKFLFGAALAAACANALADGNTGTLTFHDKQTTFIAVHVEPPNSDLNHGVKSIVFSDNSKATDLAAKVSYGMMDGVLTGDTVCSQLAGHGAHPILLSIHPTDQNADAKARNQRWVDLKFCNGDTKQPSDVSETSNKDDSKVQLNIAHEDDKRIEGSLKYVNKEEDVTADLAFALDLGPFVLFGKQPAPSEQPPPPPPPPKGH